MTSKYTGYLAPKELAHDLQHEIERDPELKIIKSWNRLFIAQGPLKNLAFAQATWPELEKFDVISIGDTVKKLKAHGKLWTHYSFHLHRRMALIQNQLPKIKEFELDGSDSLPTRVLGGWTLEDERTLWLSSQTDSCFPEGEVIFAENKSAPSRAYLKLWEFFLLTGKRPKTEERCIDMGSSPGGWTWVLSELGTQVVSVDKAPLDSKLSGRKNITYMKKDAFNLNPQDIGPVDWFFSDIICYPKDLYELVSKWMSQGQVKNFVCTIKFQGPTDFQSLEMFKAIPGSKIRHLSVNKHEVTWYLLKA